jgi:S-adenosylmethionine:tRNA-ribosyltransferase-isomerase (queuine synthetase)
MNSLRTGGRSRFLQDLCRTLLDAPPCAVDQTAAVVLTREQAAHPLFREMVDMFRDAEAAVLEQTRELNARVESRKRSFFGKDEQSLNVIENAG